MLKYHNFRSPKKLRVFYKEFSDKHFVLLDIGCGNHSASLIKKRFPNVDYYGLDRTSYNNSSEDFALMKKYYQIDLTTDDLSKIEDNFFDVILLSHVIEHLPNGLSVLSNLSKKLKTHGKIYIEFPDVKSLSFPSACQGILNFSDDPSHVKLYDIKEIANTLLENGIKIVRAGIVRDWIKLFSLFPLSLPFQLLCLLIKRKPSAKFGMWDLLGFAKFVYGEKIS